MVIGVWDCYRKFKLVLNKGRCHTTVVDDLKFGMGSKRFSQIKNQASPSEGHRRPSIFINVDFRTYLGRRVSYLTPVNDFSFNELRLLAEKHTHGAKLMAGCGCNWSALGPMLG